MAKTREKKVILTGTISVEEAEKLFGEYASLDAKEQNLTSKMDMKITKIREEFTDDLTEIAEKKREVFEKLQYFATTNKSLFEKKKSIDLTHGTLGFRTSTPSLKTAKGFTWEAVLQLVKEFLPEKYTRTKTELNKELLLSERDGLLPLPESDDRRNLPEDQRPKLESIFPKIGVVVNQDESFYVEPKKELSEAA